MQLKIADSVWWPVVIDVPTDGGLVKRLEVEGKFRLYHDDDYAALMQRKQGELLDEVLLDWRGISDEAGQPLAFSASAMTEMKRIRWALIGFTQGFVNAHNGAGRKN